MWSIFQFLLFEYAFALIVVLDLNIAFERLQPRWSVGPMDKASASGAGDSRFESWAGHCTEALGESGNS